MNIEKEIKPFFWIDLEDCASVCLNVGEYCMDVFETRTDEGFLGNGDDWESLAMVFINEKMPELTDIIEFDSEAGMFCVYSSNKGALKEFALKFKNVCENNKLMKDLFSRAKLL